MPVCVVCAGNDFICESGFFYCSECQTQSQDVRQEILDDNAEDEGQPIGGKRKRSRKSLDSSSSKEENMTSWEGFNFALAGLVDELIWLGANPKLKMVVLKLWSKYLRQMEVAFFSKQGPSLPKLGPNFKKYDANIIYGHAIQEKKVKKKNSVEQEASDKTCEESPQDPGRTAAHRRRLQQNKREAFRQTYEKMMQEMSLASQTLTDVTLEMLAVSETVDFQERKELQFSVEGKKKQHLKGQFHFHPGLLVRNKLLCLLYLGLLEVDEKINLSDLLRWISEGHLSYRNLSRFFPAEAQLQGENFNLFAAHQPSPSYGIILSATQHVAAYIGFTALKIPPLKNLIQHYIKELNLPGQIGILAERLVDLLPKLPNSFPVSLKKVMPNWEGRAMAHIIIALKLLFGLDDATEHRNSRIAKRMNKIIASQTESVCLFVWDDWVRFCVLRRTAIMLHNDSYFGQSKLTTSMAQNIDPLVSVWKKRYRSTNMLNTRSNVILDTYKHVLTRLKDKDFSKDCMNHSNLTFPATLSPYSSYCEIINKAYHEGRVKMNPSDWGLAVSGLNYEKLNQNFKNMSVDYLTHPSQYIEWAQQHGLRIGLHSGSAVQSLKVPEQSSGKCIIGNFHRVKVYLDVVNGLPSATVPLSQTIEGGEQSRAYSCHKPLIHPKVLNTKTKKSVPNIKDLEQVTDSLDSSSPKKRGRPKILTKSFEDLSKADEDNMLHTPHTEYWILHFPLSADVNFSNEAWQLPQSFMQLLEECASLVCMYPSQLYKEVMFLELLHKDLAQSLCPSQTEVNVSDRYMKAGEENRLQWFKQTW